MYVKLFLNWLKRCILTSQVWSPLGRRCRKETWGDGQRDSDFDVFMSLKYILQSNALPLSYTPSQVHSESQCAQKNWQDNSRSWQHDICYVSLCSLVFVLFFFFMCWQGDLEEQNLRIKPKLASQILQAEGPAVNRHVRRYYLQFPCLCKNAPTPTWPGRHVHGNCVTRLHGFPQHKCCNAQLHTAEHPRSDLHAPTTEYLVISGDSGDHSYAHTNIHLQQV